MSETAQDRRDKAAARRARHGDNPLANVRGRYEAAALKWEAIAVTADRIVGQRAARII